jgi:hypothetical protein
MRSGIGLRWWLPPNRPTLPLHLFVMKDTFQGFTAVRQGPTGEWPVWVAARSRAEAAVCAMVTFVVLAAESLPGRSDQPR